MSENKKMLELYAESYETASKIGDGMVRASNVAYDIRHNMVAKLEEGKEYTWTRNRLVIQKNGKFFVTGITTADHYVNHPLDADNRSGYIYLEDACHPSEGELVEIEISIRLTGKTAKDFYKNGKLIET